MTVLGLTADGKKIVLQAAAGTSSYAAGGQAITVAELNRVEQVLMAFITGGYKVGGISISGNTVTVAVHYYNYPASAAGASIEIPTGTDISAQTITLIVIGT